MSDLYLSRDTEGGRIAIGPMSSRKRRLCADPLDDISGYFLTLERDSGHLSEVLVLARIPNDEAALKLAQALSLS